MEDKFDETAPSLEAAAAPAWHTPSFTWHTPASFDAPPARREVRIREVENGWLIEDARVLGPSSATLAEFVALRERETMAILRKLLFPGEGRAK